MKVSELLENELRAYIGASEEELRDTCIDVIGEAMANMPPVIRLLTTTSGGRVTNAEFYFTNHSMDINKDQEVYLERKWKGKNEPCIALYEDSYLQHEILDMSKNAYGAISFYIPGFIGNLDIWQQKTNTGDTKIVLKGWAHGGSFSLYCADIGSKEPGAISVTKHSKPWETDGSELIGRVNTLTEAYKLIAEVDYNYNLSTYPEDTMEGAAFRSALDEYKKKQEQASM